MVSIAVPRGCERYFDGVGLVPGGAFMAEKRNHESVLVMFLSISVLTHDGVGIVNCLPVWELPYPFWSVRSIAGSRTVAIPVVARLPALIS